MTSTWLKLTFVNQSPMVTLPLHTHVFYIPCPCVIYSGSMLSVLACSATMQQINSAMLWKRDWPTGTDRQMEIEVSGQTSGCILTFSHLAFTVCGYTHLFKEVEIHTGAHTQHIQTAHWQSFKYSSIFNWKMSIYWSRNLPLIINTNVCRCAQAWIVFFVSDFWCFVAILCVRAGVSLCLCQSVVMHLGYQVCESRQPPLLASHHTERSFDGSAASSSFFGSIFSFDSQTQ